MASEAPAQYIYIADNKKRQLKKPDDDLTYIGTDESKKKDPLFYWHLDEAESAKSRLPVWVRAKDRRINPAFKAYNKAQTNIINANLAARTAKTLNFSKFSNKARHGYADHLLGIFSKPATNNVNNINELASSMSKVGFGGAKKTRRRRKSSKKTMRKRR